MSLSPKSGCLNGVNIEHEFMHALGIYHTHARRDRDRYVRIHFENIEPARKGNFYKQEQAHFAFPMRIANAVTITLYSKVTM